MIKGKKVPFASKIIFLRNITKSFQITFNLITFMKDSIEEIEGSQLGATLTADFAATPYSLTGLSSFISDLNYIVSNHKENPTHHSKTWVMCVSSLNWIMGLVNKHLSIYINDLKQGKSIEAFKISSGQYRSEDFWGLFDKVCEDLRDEPIYQYLKDNGKKLKALLAEAEITMNNGDPAIFEKFFFYKKQDFSEFKVKRKFNEWLNECHTPSILKLKELRAQAIADALNRGIFDLSPTPSQREMDEVTLDPIIQLLPYNFELTEEFKVAFAKFKRFVKMEGPILKFNYKSYGKYVLTHFYDFNVAQISAIFNLDVMLLLIHQEMERLEPEQTQKPSLSSAASTSDHQKELFHFVHPEIEEEEAWRIHKAVKRLVQYQKVPEICAYLKNLAEKNELLLPPNPSFVYEELVRLGMPTGEGYSDKYFAACYKK